MRQSEKFIKEMISLAGISVNGPHPWDIQVHNDKFYDRIISKGSLGLGESYMDGWWDCKQLDQFFTKVLTAKLDQKVKNVRPVLWAFIMAKFFNMQNKSRSKEVVEKHYDLSADLYMSFLDPYNQYTCGYFKNTDDLNKAQEQKLDLICKKLELSSKDKVLDIGCGWGGFAKFAAERYGCHVTGLSISDEQIKYAKKFCKGLPVTIIKADYRDFKGTFNKVLVCGMIEHVGYKNYRILMKKVHECLEKDGLFLLHTIGGNASVTTTEPWISKYIFPNSMLPSAKQITKSVEGLFVLEDWHNFGADYYKTLMAWHQNFTKNWNTLKESYDQRFFRMWTFYLLSCAASFRSRKNQLWQIVLSPNGVLGGYQCVR